MRKARHNGTSFSSPVKFTVRRRGKLRTRERSTATIHDTSAPAGGIYRRPCSLSPKVVLHHTWLAYPTRPYFPVCFRLNRLVNRCCSTHGTAEISARAVLLGFRNAKHTVTHKDKYLQLSAVCGNVKALLLMTEVNHLISRASRESLT